MALPLGEHDLLPLSVSAATTCIGTVVSSRRSTGRCCSSTRRIPVLGAMDGERPVTARTRVSGRMGRIWARPTVVHTASRRPSAVPGVGGEHRAVQRP